MTYKLYIKTHLITGLKYLGQTKNDPLSYKGSGVYWNRHLEIHGNNVKTKIIMECQTKDDLKKWGLYYSNLWNIVDSKEWANLKEECGDGGRQSEEVRKRISESGKGRIPWNKGKQIWSDEEKKRISNQNRMRGPQSKETIDKRVNKLLGKIRTEEQKLKSSLSQRGKKLSNQHIENLKGSRSHVIPWNKGKKLPSSSASKKWIVFDTTTGTSIEILSLKKWCEIMSFSYKSINKNFINKKYKNFIISRNEK